MVVAGTDAAAVVLPHLARQLIALHSQRADVAAQAGDPGGHPPSCARSWPHVPGIRGPGRSRPCWPRPWARTSRHRSPPGLLRRARSRHTPLRLIDPWRGASPTAVTRGSSAPCSPPPSPPCAPTPSPEPTTSANETKANRLGPGRPRPGPPPHPDPARHDPRWSPLRPTTNHETTHRRLTHHIGAPPCVWLHTRRGNRYVTVMIDLTPVRDRSGPARLLDVVPGRSKKALQDLARRSGRVLAWAGRGGSHGAGSPGSRALQARSSHRPGR